MCGIVATYSYRDEQSPVSDAALLRMRDSMTPRGPDGAGVWLNPARIVGLAHRRLSIIDLSEAGAQPMHSIEQGLSVVFNGEIYNYRELTERLKSRGYRFRSGSDTEVLLHLYVEKGEDMVHDLRGMFAFALWDEPRQKLFLARDAMGIKPLYYTDNGGVFHAASQVKALLTSACVSRAPEPAGHVGYFLWGHVPEPYTLYRSIRCLPAGTSMSVTGSGPSQPKPFFVVRKVFAEAERQVSTEAHGETCDHRTVVRAALQDSVKHHCIADVPVGLFLSSGTDSIALASAISASDTDHELETITLACAEYRGTAHDESVLAEQIAAYYGCRQSTVWLSRSDFESQMDRLLAAMDQPTSDGVNSYFVSQAAVSRGLKVALSGLGADEIFGGYDSFRQIPRLTRHLSLLNGVPGLGAVWRSVSLPALKRFSSPKYAGLFEYGSGYAGSYLLRRGMFMPWEIPDILGTDMFIAGWNELQTLERLQTTFAGVDQPHLRVSALELSWYMRNQLLRDSDWASMAHSLEVRVPFVDTILLARIAPLAAAGTISDKGELKKLAPGDIAATLVRRKKTGFSLPVRTWLREFAGLSPERGLRSWTRYVYERLTAE